MDNVAVGWLRLGLLGGTQPFPPTFGGNNYTLDGANNNGSSRRIAASPNSDMIQEMRVESANFDASVGHGLGLQISMMTRAHGTSRHRRTTIQLVEQAEFADRAAEGDLRRPREERVREGRSHNVSLIRRSRADSGTRRRPRQAVLLRELLAGQRCHPRQDQGIATIPANDKHLQGDFSDLLGCPIRRGTADLRSMTTRLDPRTPTA